MHEQFIRYRRVTYQPVPAKSRIEAYVELGAPDLTLRVIVQSKHEARRNDDVPCLRATTGCHGAGRWRDITGIVSRTEYSIDDLYLRSGENLFILPNIPASLYDGRHYALNHHRFRFTQRRADTVLVDWTCVALDHPRNHKAVVRARVRLSSVTVWSESNRVRATDAQAELARRFPEFTFGKPTRFPGGLTYSRSPGG